MSREYVEKRLREIAQAQARSHARRALTSRAATPPTKSPEVRGSSASSRRAHRSAEPPPAPPAVLPEVHISARFVYECVRGIIAQPLDPERQVGEFLDLLLGALEARPAYVHPSDLPRYAALVRRFRASMYHDWKDPVPVASLPLVRLHVALNEWLRGVLREASDPLMPSFCLDAARFIEAHAHGRFFDAERENWELRPMVSNAGHHWEFEVSRDQRLKREITSAVKGQIVRCAIPQGFRIFDVRSQTVVAASGEAFVEIVRCHLSQGFGVDYGEHLVIQDETTLRHDIAEEFRFLANYWPPLYVGQLRRGEICAYQQEADLHRVQIPARWITGWLDYSRRPDSGSVPLWEAVPTWAEGVPAAGE
jgi:hypothetical protein